MTMDEYAIKFLEMLRYVKYIEDQKVNIQRFPTGLPQLHKYIVELHQPQTLKTMRKAMYYYDQNKNRPELHKTWKENEEEMFDQRKKRFKPCHYKNHPKDFQQKQQAQNGTKPIKLMEIGQENIFNVGDVEKTT